MDWSSGYKPERETSWSDIADSIRNIVRVRDILFLYRPDLPHRGHRCPCPLHNGEDFNFSYNDNGYKCFVCGESGDCISLAQALCNCPSRSDAMKRINDDMRLGLPIGRAATFEQSMDMLRRREDAQKKKDAREKWDNEYALLMDEWARLDKIRMTAPPDSDEYANALKNIAHIDYEIEYHLLQEPR